MALKFSIKIQDVDTRDCEFLTDPGEITLQRWASYFERLETMPDWFKDFHNAGSIEERQGIQKNWDASQWAESYIIFAKLSLTFVNGAKLDDLLEMPLEGEGVNSLISLFGATMHNVYGYKPKGRDSFEWKGRKFKVFSSQKIAGQDIPGADMTVRDAINALQLEHSWQQHTSGGANHYNINVGVLAALSREVLGDKVEVPPVDGPAAMKWQADRQTLFADVPMDIALDVVFFSTGLKALSPNILLSLSCLLQASPSG